MRKQISLIHLAFWAYILIQTFSPILFIKIENDQLPYLFISVILGIINFYLIYFFVFNQIYLVKRKWLIVLKALLAIVLISGFRLMIYYLFSKYITQIPPEKLFFESHEIYGEVRITVVNCIYAFLLKSLIDWLTFQKKEADTLTQNQASEIALLRSQINPHFLFNTLNNIYSLVYKKSDDAPEAIMKLSDIMRYMLYESNSEKVLLSKEIIYIKSFIELYQLRLKDKNFINFSVNGDVQNIMIAPMLIIPLVENAIKHGLKNISPGIIIKLEIEKQLFKFSVTNYYDPNEMINKDIAGGIGISNLIRRLDLIYPKKYNFIVDKIDKSYKVNLSIELE
jgi:two-component system LytT family sensor kinase